ncbi:MAG: GTPase Era [Clostridia bacterium]|nr:GTPase Era [Clostridia bacterium]
MEKIFKSGFVSLVGRTNVGKSTLLNSLVQEEVAITTKKTQTTRKAIKAIINRKNSQIIITDTPGIHKPKTKLSETMIETAFGIFKEVDLILFVIEATSLDVGRGDRRILEKIKEANKPCILVINKIDLSTKEQIAKLISFYSKEYDFNAVVPVSSIKNKGIEVLLLEIEKLLPKGPKYYEDDEYTDQTSRELVEEKVREKALKLLNDEVPHGIYVEVENFKNRLTKNGESIIDIDVLIYCLRESHKGIIIGKDGKMLKKISTFARQDLETILGTKINLKVWVKVKEDWQEKEDIINKFKLK